MSDELDIRIDNDLAQNDKGNILGMLSKKKQKRSRSLLRVFQFHVLWAELL